MVPADQNKEKSGSKLNKLATEGLLIFLLPALGYVIAVTNEIGYAEYFKYDKFLIVIHPLLFTYSIITVILFVIILLMAMNMISWLFRIVNRPDNAKYFYLLALSLVHLSLNLLLFDDYKKVLYISIFSGILVFTIYIMPIFLNIFSPKFGYFDGVKEMWVMGSFAMNPFRKERNGDPTNYIYFTILFYLFLVVIPSASYMLGYTSASRREVFWVFDDIEKNVVLKIFGDSVVTATLLNERGEISQTYRVVGLDDVEAYRFRNERVGPLTLAPMEGDETSSSDASPEIADPE